MFEIYRNYVKYVKTQVNCPKAQVDLAKFRLFCLAASVHLLPTPFKLFDFSI